MTDYFKGALVRFMFFFAGAECALIGRDGHLLFGLFVSFVFYAVGYHFFKTWFQEKKEA